MQDLLVRRQFSLVPDNRTNVNVEPWEMHNIITKSTNLHVILRLSDGTSEKIRDSQMCRYDGQIYFHWYKILGLLYKRALFDLQFILIKTKVKRQIKTLLLWTIGQTLMSRPATNQKQEWPVASMFVHGSGRNEQTL
jgi:hypothetical protein